MFILFLIISSIQFGFIFFVFSRLAFYKNVASDSKRKKINGISVIIAAHNEYENLQKLIPALLKQTHSNYEIIIVNNHSTDTSESFLKLQSEKYKSLIIKNIRELPKGIHPKKNALKVGIQIAKYETLLLTDADCIPLNNEWISNIENTYLPNTEIVLGYSQYYKLKGFLNAFIRYETFFTAVQYFSFALSGMPYMGVGRNISYTKKLFSKNSGFGKHAKITGGDDDLFTGSVAKTENTQIAISAATQTISAPKTTLKSWITQKKRHLSVGKHYQFRHKVVLGFLNFSQIYFYLLLLIIGILGGNTSTLLLVYLARMSSLVFLFWKIKHKMKDNQLLWILPIFDFIYTFYLVFVGILAFSTKKTKWK